jgi:hypothetical protein
MVVVIKETLLATTSMGVDLKFGRKQIKIKKLTSLQVGRSNLT